MSLIHYGSGKRFLYGPAPRGYVPLSASDPGLVFGSNLNNERVDVTGNHVLNGAVLYTASKSYDGLRHMAELPADSASRIFTDSGTAHQIATANPVSYGGMFFLSTVQAIDNATLVSSATSSGPTNQNYGVRYKVSTTKIQRVPGAVDSTITPPLETHFHLVVVEPAGRGSAKIYINGVLQDTVTPLVTGAPQASDDLFFGEGPFTNSGAAGWASDVFVSNLELSDAQVLQFATNAFGGTPPAFP